MKPSRKIGITSSVVMIAALFVITAIKVTRSSDHSASLEERDFARQRSSSEVPERRRQNPRDNVAQHQPANELEERKRAVLNLADTDLVDFFDASAEKLEDKEISDLLYYYIKGTKVLPENKSIVSLIEMYSIDKSSAYSAVVGKVSSSLESLWDFVDQMPQSTSKSKGYQRYFFESITDVESLARSIAKLDVLEAIESRRGATMGMRQSIRSLTSKRVLNVDQAVKLLEASQKKDALVAELISEIQNNSEVTSAK